MPNRNTYELEILSAFEHGKFESVATKRELAKFKAMARATAQGDIPLSAPDLADIKVRTLECVPYQTLIASVLHKYVTGRLAEKDAQAASRAKRTRKRA